MRKSILIAACLFLGIYSHASITLPAIFSDHMVLQQDATVTIWGWAKPGEVVKITPGWDTEKVSRVMVTSNSVWSINIETPSAGGPYELLIQGSNTIEISDVLIGEVWLGSGQSNMEWTAAMKIDNAEEEIQNANYPQIRFFTVSITIAETPQQLLQGEWVSCTPETMKHFSALMYFFGRELQGKLNVPVGLINSSWGGTPIEIWMPEPSIRGDRVLDQGAKLLEPVPWGPVEPGKAYNSMIHPLIPYRIKGALWYQGEANVSYPVHYARALKTLIDSWRASWGYDFPFYYAQIAPWEGYGSDGVNGAIIRDQQRKALDMTDRTGMVVLSDIGNLKDIHPGNKQDAGKRLASWALHHDYGFTELPFSGPLIRSHETDGGRIILNFDHADDGLEARDGALREFEVLDGSGSWTEAKASIKKNTVIIESPVANPQGIRHAYRNDSNPNLFNKNGLPASCFEILFNSTNQQ